LCSAKEENKFESHLSVNENVNKHFVNVTYITHTHTHTHVLSAFGYIHILYEPFTFACAIGVI